MSKYLIQGCLDIDNFLDKKIPEEIRMAASAMWFSYSNEDIADQWLDETIQLLEKLDWEKIDPSDLAGAIKCADWAIYVMEDRPSTLRGSTELWGNVLQYLLPPEELVTMLA